MTDNSSGNDGGYSIDKPTATVTLDDGDTHTITDFSITSAENNLSYPDDAEMEGVSIGLKPEQTEFHFQATVEVPTKTVVCMNCNHPNTVPVWAFAHVEFGADELEHLSGDYAVGHQCVKCGFPYLGEERGN